MQKEKIIGTARVIIKSTAGWALPAAGVWLIVAINGGKADLPLFLALLAGMVIGWNDTRFFIRVKSNGSVKGADQENKR